MENIAEVDPNLRVQATLDLPDIKFYDPKQAPFRIYGVSHDGKKFKPPSILSTLSALDFSRCQPPSNPF